MAPGRLCSLALKYFFSWISKGSLGAKQSVVSLLTMHICPNSWKNRESIFSQVYSHVINILFSNMFDSSTEGIIWSFLTARSIVSLCRCKTQKGMQQFTWVLPNAAVVFSQSLPSTGNMSSFCLASFQLSSGALKCNWFSFPGNLQCEKEETLFRGNTLGVIRKVTPRKTRG